MIALAQRSRGGAGSGTTCGPNGSVNSSCVQHTKLLHVFHLRNVMIMVNTHFRNTS